MTAIETLLAYFTHSASCEQLSDEELSRALISFVWSHTTVGSYECALVAEAIERLRVAQPGTAKQPLPKGNGVPRPAPECSANPNTT